MFARLLLAMMLMFTPTERGPWLLIGRIPDRNPYGCGTSASATRVPSAASITDDLCAVWTLGTGSSPTIQQLRNGVLIGTGIQILWYHGILYLQGNDSNWYSWLPATGYTFYGVTDPETGGGVPTGIFVSLPTNTPAGDDSRSCATAANAATPLATIGKGVTCPTAGQTLYIRGGFYDETLRNPTINSGTSWANKVRITNYPGEVVWMSPSSVIDYVLLINRSQSYIEWDGINMDGTNAPNGVIKLEASLGFDPHHIRIQNAELIGNAATSTQVAGVTLDHQGSTATAVGFDELINLTIHDIGGLLFSHGIYTKSASTTIDHCTIYNFPGSGIQFFSGFDMSGGVAKNNTIFNPRHTQSDQVHWGIVYADGSTSGSVYNNVIYNIHLEAQGPMSSSRSFGIQVFDNSNIGVYNNTIYNVDDTGIELDGTHIAKNNILYMNGTNLTNNGGTASNNLLGTNPNFVNPGTDFHVQAGSPAIDTGVSISGVFMVDKDGIPRPQGALWDMGAYEFH